MNWGEPCGECGKRVPEHERHWVYDSKPFCSFECFREYTVGKAEMMREAKLQEVE